MESMTLKELASMCKGLILQGNPSAIVAGINTDSRKIKLGESFVALKGDNFDGHDFLQQAIDNGASVLIVNQKNKIPKTDVAIIDVPCTYKALEHIATDYSKKFNCRFIGITGSVGKTTTKEVAAHLLGYKNKVLKPEKSFNNSLGIPLTLLQMNKEHQFAVMEVGANHQQEIRNLVKIFRPTIGVITCVAECHLEGFGGLQGVEQAKSELMEEMDEKGIFITNADDPACVRIAKKFTGNLRMFSRYHPSDYQAVNVKTTAEAISFVVNQNDITVPIVGEHHIYNILAGIAIARESGMDWLDIQKSLQTFRLPPLRNQIEKYKGITVINDAYNASPKSMIAALEMLCQYPSGNRKVAIVGSMLELGLESERLHTEVGVKAATYKLDYLWVVGKEGYPIATGAVNAGMPIPKILCFHDKIALIKELPSLIKDGDTILLKASRRIGLDTIAPIIKQLING